jgi:hypothetical protein
MGKPRKIEIDDYMPVNEEDELIFPQCEKLEELWPAIITKAVIKLFSYKFKYNARPENIVGDFQILNSLTGYFSDLKKSNFLKGQFEVEKLLDKLDIINLNKDKEKNFNTEKDNLFMLCYNFTSKPDEKEKILYEKNRNSYFQTSKLVPKLDFENKYKIGNEKITNIDIDKDKNKDKEKKKIKLTQKETELENKKEKDKEKDKEKGKLF